MGTGLNILLAANFSGSWFVGDLPENTRVERLKPYFDPQPGERIVIPSRKKFEGYEPENAKGLFTHVVVTPPKGRCIIVSRFHQEPDQKVCSRTKVRVSVDDINDQGLLKLNVFTGREDVGTHLSWPTPHRIGKAVLLGNPIAGRSFAVYTSRCATFNDDKRGRYIELDMLHGRRWTVKIPEAERRVDQSDSQPNLYIQGAEGVANTGKINRAKKLIAGKKGIIIKKKEAKEFGLDGSMSKYASYKALPPSSNWQMFPRQAFEMSAENLLTNGSTTPGMYGTCRYRYFGYRHDRRSGVIECQLTAEFQWIYLPLPCLPQLKMP